MADFIYDLKTQHAEIFETLNSANEFGIISEDGRERLLSAKVMLLAHLKKEDEQLYPGLHDAAKRNDNLETTVEVFLRDIAGIRRLTIDFFNKYAEGGSPLQFARDFGVIFITLSKRIRQEESILYPEFEKLLVPADVRTNWRKRSSRGTFVKTAAGGLIKETFA